MVDSIKANGLDDTLRINRVDVHVRANDFQNDIAWGKVIVHRLIFYRVA